MNIRLNRCKLVKADDKGRWEIVRCPTGTNVVYVVRAWEEKIEHIAEAFVKAKEEGFINELSTIYWMECGDWIGVVGIYDTVLNVTVTDYSKMECMAGFMEIVKEVVRRLSEVKR
jgi:hypothetical protein